MNAKSCFGDGNHFSLDPKTKLPKQIATYEERKKNLKLPKNMEKFFRLLEDIRLMGYSKAIKKRNSEEIQNSTNNFFKTFDRLSPAEKNHYLLQLIIQADRKITDRYEPYVQKTLTLDTVSQNDTIKDPQRYLESKCRFCSAAQKTLGLIKNWHQSIIKLNKLKKRLTVKHKNTIFHLPLRSYILRSKNEPLTFSLESTHQFQQRNLKTIMFNFTSDSKQKIQEFYRNTLDIIVTYQIEKLMMENVFNDKLTKINDPKKNKIRLFLSENTIKKCVKKIQSFENLSNNQKSYQRVVLKQQFENNQNIVISQYRNSNGTWYQGLTQIYDKHDPKLVNFLQIYHHSHRYLTKFNILETCCQDNDMQTQKDFIEQEKKYCAFFQKLKINQKIYGQDIFAQKTKKKEENKQQFCFVSLNDNLIESFFQFLKITLWPSEDQSLDSHFRMKILVKFSENFSQNKNSEEIFMEFIKEFYIMFERLRGKNTSQASEFHIKEINSKFFIEKDLISRYQSEEGNPMDFLKKNADPSSLNVYIKRLSIIDIPEYAFLRKRHRVIPTSQKIGKLMKQHFLYKQWQRLPKGGLKCTNTELVAFQKSLYKTVMKKFGQNLIKGKNIINFSLPVVCFKKESHLQSLAQSMCYCPIYLQKAAKIKDPLERMKFSVIIMIAVGILTVQSEKPFNPILGETYQGYIDGCPVYMEQISHHPPISAYYMVGRGYKMYGCVEPRISLHFNGATGYSNLPHYIEFDDGTIIELVFAKITITGMMFGDRQFYFQDKIYAFDKTNNLFAEMIFGPFKSGGIFSLSSEPQDYFHGKIYEVSEKFKTQFNKSTPRIYPGKNDILKEHLMFDGIWSGSIHVDGEQIINFKTDLPYEFVEQQYPIPSDSRYRKDLQKLVQGDKQEAQKYKQELEEEQRKDKKLRNEKQ